MKKFHGSIAMVVVALVTAGMLMACVESSARGEGPAGPGPQLGKAAPAFSVADTNGKTHALDQYRGKWVVLEWLNHDCGIL